MSENKKERKMTKEELAKAWKEYYDWLDSIYSVKSFEIQGKEGEVIHFFHGFNMREDGKKQSLTYYLRDKEYREAFEHEKEQDLLGEARDEKSVGKTIKAQAFISINTEEKWLNFGAEWDYRRRGYGKAIYDNYLNILGMLGIEDKEQYELRVYGNRDHDFLKRMHTKELVAKTNGEPDNEKALQILEEFSKHHTMKFSELNTIVQYAINSKVPTEEIAKAINENGFNIFYDTVNGFPHFVEEEVKQFKSFGITGLKPSRLHQHFMRGKNFGFMRIVTDANIEDATLEFRRIFEEVKKEHEKDKEEGRYITPNLEKFGELEHIILDWPHSGLLFKNVTPEIQQVVKKQAISKFELFNPEHSRSWNHDLDDDSIRTFRMLNEAGLMDKEAYIALYQKALNRNYNLDEFDKSIFRFIDRDERMSAREEISQNVYYPSPKGKWQKSHYGQDRTSHSIAKVVIHQRVSKKGNVRELIKQEILKQGIAKKTKIKTDMTGIDKDGKPFVVDNLKDWLFGVPGAKGNMQMMGTAAVTLPPQTPKFAINLIQKALRDIEYPEAR